MKDRGQDRQGQGSTFTDEGRHKDLETVELDKNARDDLGKYDGRAEEVAEHDKIRQITGAANAAAGDFVLECFVRTGC